MTIPKWNNLSSYAYTLDLDGPGWAWEILRRNKEFILDCKQLKNGTLTDAHGNSTISFGDTKLGLVNKGKYFLEPPLNKTESLKSWITNNVADSEAPPFFTPHNYLLKKWGLRFNATYPSLKAIDLQGPIKFSSQRHYPRILDYLHLLDDIDFKSDGVSSEGLDMKNGGSTVIVEFSLDATLSTQWNSILQRLKKIQETKPTKTRTYDADVLLRVIRLIDANQQSPTESTNDLLYKIYEAKKSGSEIHTLEEDKNRIIEFHTLEGHLKIANANIKAFDPSNEKYFLSTLDGG